MTTLNGDCMYNGGANQSTAGFGNAAGWVPVPLVTGTLIGNYPAKPDEGERVLVLDRLTNELSMSNNRLFDLLTRVREHADSIFGTQPETKGAGANSLPREASRLAGLSDAIRGTDALISDLLQQISRLTAL